MPDIDHGIKAKGRQISSTDVQTVILLLTQLLIPNLQRGPAFNPKEVQNFFSVIHYPFTIRADAITAVGAPSSVSFLMKAIFWLYLVAKSFYRMRNPMRALQISEEVEDDLISNDDMKSLNHSQFPA